MVLTASILFLFFIKHGSAFNELLSVEELNRFPPLRHVDRFSQCLDDKGGVYCTGEIEFVADGPSELYDAMWNFSKSPKLRLNYTKGVYGYCMTRRCKEFLTGDSEMALQTALGACLNSTLQREYELRARIHRADCYRHGHRPSYNWLDWAATALFTSFIGLAVLGTLYDVFATKKDTKGYLMCFSLPSNWTKLMAPWPVDKATSRLIGINGMRYFDVNNNCTISKTTRSITSLMVVIGHAMLFYQYGIDNMHSFEIATESPLVQIMFQGPVIMQTFFFFSGFFMAYSWERTNERNPKTWRSMPRTILLRWLRLAPLPYVTVLFSMTWLKHAPLGPFWQQWVNSEVVDCWKNWPAILSFRQNYADKLTCNIHLWSTAVDFQFHIIGLTVMLLSPNKRIRNLVLWTLLAIGVALPVVVTYAYDLNGNLLMVAKMMELELLFQNKTFTHLYTGTHTNLAGFASGMIMGIILLDWQKNLVDFSKYKKYTILYWLLFPALIFLSYSNTFVLWGSGDMSTRLLIALLRNPAWIATIALITIGVVFQVEKVALYRRVLEWPGWVPLARMSFCMYAVHLPITYWLLGSSHTLVTLSILHMEAFALGALALSVIVGAAAWLMVEAPCTNIVAKLFPEKRTAQLACSADKTE